MSRHADSGELLERGAELELLADAVAAVTAGESRIVVVRGPAGIGKTSLLEHALRTDGVATHGARGIDLERDFAFGTILRLLGPHITGPHVPPEAASALRDLLRDGRSPPREAEELVAQGIVQLLRARVRRSPLLVAVDDLQWCDPPSVRTLAKLATGDLSGLALLIAFRDGEPEPDEEAVRQLLDTPGVDVLSPLPLTPAALLQLGAGRLDAAEAEVIHRHTGGNPLFAGEVLRDRDGCGEGPPTSLVRLMGRRLEQLPGDVRRVATALAILNGHAERQLVGATTSLETAALDDALEQLAARGIVDVPTMRFRHPVVREAVLSALPLAERAALHLGAARLLAVTDPRRAAVHLLGAADRPAARTPWAATVLLAASREAGDGSDERLRYLRHALTCDLDAGDEATALAALGVALAQRDDPSGELELGRARQIAVGPSQAADIAVQHAESLFHLARMAEAAAVCRSALGELPPGAPELREVRMRLEATALAAEAADGAVRRPVVPAGLLEGEEPSLGERAVLSRLAWTLATMGTVPAAEVARVAHRALGRTALLQEAGPSSPAFVYAASALVIAGEPEAVVEVTGEAARSARAAGSPVGVAYALALRGQAHVARGDVVAAAADAQTALDALDATTLPALSVAMAWRLETAIVLGDIRDAWTGLQHAGLAEQLPDLGPVHLLLLARAGLHRARGDAAAALDDLLLLRRRVGPRYANPSSLIWHPRLAEALLATGDRDGASQILEAAVDRAERFGVARALGVCLRVRGTVLGGAPGEEDLRRAVELLDVDPDRIELARALLELGTARHAAGDAEGRTLLRRGLLEAHGAGAVTVVDEAMRRLRASGARPRRPRVPGTHALRPQRRLVIELAAEGLGDGEIGDRLFLREETVAEHITAGLRALGLPSRAALRRGTGPPERPGNRNPAER